MGGATSASNDSSTFVSNNSSTSASNGSSMRVQWMWNGSANPFSLSPSVEWKPYSDGENMIIEEAFQAGQKHAILDTYSIDFKYKVQILNTDSDKQRPVKRMTRNRDDNHLREERFTFTPINPKRPFGGLYGWISPFIRETAKDLNITQYQLPSKDRSTVPMIVEKAALGIIEEGKKIGKQREAELFAKKLREKKNAGMKEVWKCCAHLYSLESFLYQKLNETMRLIGSKEHEQDWRNNVRTLGPFCLLLWDNPFNNKTTPRGTVLYRGANLSDEMISAFKDDCSKKDKPKHSFPSFTSCSRNRHKAEPFGNVLFIMVVKHAFTVDLQAFSEYPDEEEELLSPGVCFTVDRVDKLNNKHLIYLDLVQQYSQTDRQEISDYDRLVPMSSAMMSSSAKVSVDVSEMFEENSLLDRYLDADAYALDADAYALDADAYAYLDRDLLRDDDAADLRRLARRDHPVRFWWNQLLFSFPGSCVIWFCGTWWRLWLSR